MPQDQLRRRRNWDKLEKSEGFCSSSLNFLFRSRHGLFQSSHRATLVPFQRKLNRGKFPHMAFCNGTWVSSRDLLTVSALKVLVANMEPAKGPKYLTSLFEAPDALFKLHQDFYQEKPNILQTVNINQCLLSFLNSPICTNMDLIPSTLLRACIIIQSICKEFLIW